MTEVPSDDHGQVIHNIHESFSAYRRAHPGLILRIGHGSDIRLIIPELESDRHPDLAIVFRGASRNSRGRQIPTLVVEVVSPGKTARSRDYQAKREEYLFLGIREYWVVDFEAREVLALVRQGDGTGWEDRLYRGNEVVESVSLPDYSVPLVEFWADLPTGD